MPCGVPSFSVGYPLGGPVQVTCSGGTGTLSTAFGSVSTDCRSTQVRGRINGGGWVTAPVSPWPIGGTFIASWTLRNIPGATCDNTTDILELEVEVTDPATGAVSWIAGNPVAFSAYCFMMPMPMRMDVANIFELEVSKLLPPSLLWTITEGKLAATKSVKLKRARSSKKMDSPGAPLWRSIGAAEGLWALVLGTEKRALLTLRLKGNVGGTTFEFEFQWGCGKFRPYKGGLFGPVGENPIPQVLAVTAPQSEQGATIRARRRAKPKAKRSARKRRPRR